MTTKQKKRKEIQMKAKAAAAPSYVGSLHQTPKKSRTNYENCRNYLEDANITAINS